MAIREVLQLGDVILREISKEVTEIDEEVLTLLKDMADTMYDAGGVGIAAPQVGVLKRIVVIDVEKGQGLINLINPEIVEIEDSHEVVEGCLSIEHKKKRGKLLRPVKVTVKALNEKGEKFTMTGENLLAQAFCHEIDHLDGILIVDKVTEWLPPKVEEDK
jgi:peptide deformylase